MYNSSKRNIILSKKEGRRFKKLGDFGEIIAEKLLKENGFLNIQNLNSVKMNFPFADLYAEKER